MRNILRAPLDAGAIAAILARHDDVALLPPLGDPQWRAAFAGHTATAWMDAIRTLAERERAEPLPALTDALYGEYHLSGNRSRFEQVYFERRRRLARAALCTLADGESWLPSLTAKLTDVFEETSWALPAHTGCPSGKNPTLIDLFAAETAHLMGELLTLFADVLPTELAQRVSQRLHNDVLLNLRDRSFSWQTCQSNWNAVCHQGVLGAALAVEQDHELTAALLTQAGRNLVHFLDGFTPDGGCNEGLAYWGYGFGWFCELNRQLETRSGGELSLVEGDRHVAELVDFAARMTLADGYVVNFADCPPRMSIRPDFLLAMGERFDDADARTLGLAHYRQLAATGLDLHDPRTDVFYLTRLFLRCPVGLDDRPDAARPDRSGERRDAFLPDLGVLVARGRDRRGHLWEFAAKAGHNGEHHNHNDCGSWLLHVDGQPQVVELGSPEYVRDYFGPRRYEYLAARTRGHSLPIINGCEQAVGRAHAARLVDHKLSDDRVLFVVDITACYPVEASCRRCVRTFMLDQSAGELCVRDDVELDRVVSLEAALITRAGVTIESDVIHLGCLSIRPDPDVAASVETYDYRDVRCADHTIRRLVLRPRQLADVVSLTCRLSLCDDGVS